MSLEEALVLTNPIPGEPGWGEIEDENRQKIMARDAELLAQNVDFAKKLNDITASMEANAKLFSGINYDSLTKISGISTTSALIAEIDMAAGWYQPLAVILKIYLTSGGQHTRAVYMITRASTTSSIGIKAILPPVLDGTPNYIPNIDVTYNADSKRLQISQIGSVQSSGTTYFMAWLESFGYEPYSVAKFMRS